VPTEHRTSRRSHERPEVSVRKRQELIGSRPNFFLPVLVLVLAKLFRL